MNLSNYHCINLFLLVAGIVEMHIWNMFNSTTNIRRKALWIVWFLFLAWWDVGKGDFLHEQLLCWTLIFSTSFIVLQQVATEWIILLLFEISIMWNFCLTNWWENRNLLNCSVSIHGCGVSQSVKAVYVSKGSGNSFVLLYIYLYRENNKYLSCK